MPGERGRTPRSEALTWVALDPSHQRLGSKPSQQLLAAVAKPPAVLHLGLPCTGTRSPPTLVQQEGPGHFASRLYTRAETIADRRRPFPAIPERAIVPKWHAHPDAGRSRQRGPMGLQSIHWSRVNPVIPASAADCRFDYPADALLNSQVW